MKIFREILWPLLAVLAAFVVGGMIILLIGDDPIEAYGWLLSSSFGSAKDIGYTLFFATPLIFTGLGCRRSISLRPVEHRGGRATLRRGVRNGVGRH